MKYLTLLLVPSSILQWLLLIAFAVVGWFISAQRTGNQKDTANAVGILCGILMFYGLKNILGGLGDIFDRDVTKYFEYKSMALSLRNTIFPSLVNFLFSILRIVIGSALAYSAYNKLPLTPDEKHEQEEANRLAEIIVNSNDANRTLREIDRQAERQRNTEQAERTIIQMGENFNMTKAEDGQPNYHGYKLVDEDNGGRANPLWNTLNPLNIQQARNQYRLYGEPGGGLSQSDFSANEIQSGQKGEQVLANMITGNCPNVVSFWSLHGLDDQHRPTNSDIDCVIAGQDKQGNTHIWFVDAKNYKGNADTAYRNVAPNQLVRLCISQRAFEKGVDGRPDLELSSNMDWQRKTWASMFLGKPVVVEWLVCMVPTSDKGVPNVDGVTWPGNIPCVTPEELVRRVNAVGLDSVQNIPLDWLNTFKRQLKH